MGYCLQQLHLPDDRKIKGKQNVQLQAIPLPAL
jgi:hypothetical protein